MAGIPWVMPALTTDSGVPVSGAKVFSRIMGTATPTPLYADAELTTPATNPAIADAGGRLRVYRDPTTATDIIVKTADEAITLIPTTSYPEEAPLDLGDGWADVLAGPAAGILDNLSGVRFVATNAALTALTTGTGLADMAVYQTMGAATDRDGGEGLWLYYSGSTATADGWMILAIDGGGPGRFYRLAPDVSDWQTIASASTVNLGAATSNKIVISGTTTINSFGTVASGARFLLRFSGVCRLTHNAAALVLPGSTDLVTAADDVFEAVSSGAGVWRIFASANPYITLGTAADPISVDATFGFVGRAVQVHATPGAGASAAHTVGILGRSYLQAGSRGIAVGMQAEGYSTGTHASGGDFETGAIGGSFGAYSTRGTTVFGASFNANATDVAGSLMRGTETDLFSTSAAHPGSKIWSELVSPNSDTGVATITYTVSGSGNTIYEDAFNRMSAVGAGVGARYGLLAVKASGGTQPIYATGALIRSGGYTSDTGWDARDHAVTTALILGGNDQQLVSARNAANNANVKALRVAGDNTVVVGDQFVVNPTSGDTSTPGIATLSKGLIIGGIGGSGATPGTIGKDANYGMIFRPNTAVAAQADYLWMDYASNTAMRLGGSASSLGAGLVVGAPTGGFKGAGTVNAQAVYDDNVLLSCFVLDAALDGSVDLEKWDAKVPDRVHDVFETLEVDGEAQTIKTGERIEVRTHVGALKFSQRLGTEYDPLTLDGYAKHWKEKRHLTAFPNEARFQHGDMGTGEWIQRLIETAEIQAVLIESLNGEIKSLKQTIERIVGSSPDQPV